jgi:hypothetical protein
MVNRIALLSLALGVSILCACAYATPAKKHPEDACMSWKNIAALLFSGSLS